MQPNIAERLIALNREFYQSAAPSFSATRQRVQPGVERILKTLPEQGRWLDVGCGNGSLARAWLALGKHGQYCGVDFSEKLLADARRLTKMESVENAVIEFYMADISHPDWVTQCDQTAWDGVFLMAALHHIPSSSLRVRLLRSIAQLLKPEGSLYLSVWQPQNCPRLWARRQDWRAADFNADEVDEGDVLLDWRAERTEANKTALRYVHIFQSGELRLLAKSCGFSPKEEYLSDGKEKNLALYQRWVKHPSDEQPSSG